MSVWYIVRESNFDFSNPDYRFDAVRSEAYELAFDVSQYPVEAGADVSDAVHELPRKFSASGWIVEVPFDDTLSLPFRRSRVIEDLEALALEKQVVTLVSPLWIADVVIAKVSAEHGQDSGESVEVSIDFQTVARPGFSLVQIPEALLRADVQASSTPAPDIGSLMSPAGATAPAPPAAGTAEDAVSASWLVESADAYEKGTLDTGAALDILAGGF